MRRAIALLILVPIGLVLLGIAVIASTSGVAGLRYQHDANFYLLRQVVFSMAAVVACMVLAGINYRVWSRNDIAWCLILLILVGLIAVFIPGIAVHTKGSSRWVNLRVIQVQPSEFIRIALIVVMAAWQGRISRHNERLVEGCLIPVGLLGVVALGFLRQPDFGATFLTAVVSLAMMFIAGVRVFHLLGVGLFASLGIGALILRDPGRIGRVTSVYAPQLASDAEMHQIRQSLSAFQRGGLFGVGYGNSLLKERYLPESHTDFILSMAGEELGLVCTALTVAAYALLLLAGLTASLRAPDKFGRLLAFGMTFHLCFSAAFNIAVVTRMAPTKGLALPFVSYGGSNLLASMAALGFILSVARRAGDKVPIPVRPDAMDSLADIDSPPGRLAMPLAESF